MISAWAGHFVGDFLLQNDWMARAKPGAHHPNAHMVWWVFGLHILVAGGLPAIFAGWRDWRGLASVAAHLTIDGLRIGRRWPKWVGQIQAQPGQIPWIAFIDDQVLHLFSLWLIGIVGR